MRVETIFVMIWLGILAILDLRHGRVPVWLVVLGGIIMTMVSKKGGLWESASLMELVWRFWPGAFLLAAAVCKKAGWADGAVLLILGMGFTPGECTAGFAISLVLSFAISLLLLAFRKIRLCGKLPYLPFLWMGYLMQAAAGRGVVFP